MTGSCARALANMIRANFVKFAGDVRVEPVTEQDWASVIFCGARHRLRATLQGPGAVGAAAEFLARMADVELPIPGHIVADIALISEARRDGGDYACLELEALTIEEG